MLSSSFEVIAYDNRIVLEPERPIQDARGSLKGIDTTIERWPLTILIPGL
jgi:hypothetical protein